MSNNIKLYLGDSKEVLKQIPSNSVDLIVTDPPYQLDSIRERFGKKDSAPAKFGKDGAFQRASKGFMGKKWDVLPPIEVWEECLRVLKPGAFAFVMTTTRQDSLCQILMDLSKAGFCMGFSSIYWSYATGFPKASNISKLIDKQECKKQLTEKLGRKPTKKEFDEAWGDYRKVIGKGKSGSPETHKSSYQMSQQEDNTFGGEYEITEPKNTQAKELDGSYGGFQPKPAVEIIIVAMKSLDEKTYVDQALKNGHGITHLDNCRIPYESENDIIPQIRDNKREVNAGKMYRGNSLLESKTKATIGGSKKGRFPANLLVSDDVLNDGKITKSTGGSGEKSKGGLGKKVYGKYKLDKKGEHSGGLGDSGSYSRYFDLDKWWVERVKKLPPEVQKVFPYLIVPKASKKEKNKGLVEKGTGSNTYNKKCLTCGKWQRKQGLTDDYTCHCEKPNWEKAKGNLHPTVKPIKLMAYLITLGSKEGEVVLDPFMGSGTTGISAKLLNRKFIGIEMSEEYIKIAKARIEGWKNIKGENND